MKETEARVEMVSAKTCVDSCTKNERHVVGPKVFE